MTNHSEEGKNLSGFLDLAAPGLISLLGENYDKKTINTLVGEGREKAEKIIDGLRPFSNKNSFPESYNLRAIHALFAQAFLYISPLYKIFIETTKLRGSRSVAALGFLDEREFIVYMMENFHNYEYIAQFYKGTTRCYGDISDEFKNHHILNGSSSFVNDQLVLVVDFANPVDNILNDVKRIIEEAQGMYCDVFQEEVRLSGGNINDIRIGELPISFGRPLTDSQGVNTRTEYTQIPQWHEAFCIYLLYKDGESEEKITEKIYGEPKESLGYDARSSTVYRRKILAERLIEAAFRREPLSWAHKQAVRTNCKKASKAR